MHKTAPLLIQRCKTLRRRGFSLGVIVRVVHLSKTTVYGHIRDINLSPKIRNRLNQSSIRQLIAFNHKRKGKCLPGRIVPKPKEWLYDLIYLVAHFMFDGEIRSHGSVYSNRNGALINEVRILMKKAFNLEPYIYLNKETGVYKISYHCI